MRAKRLLRRAALAAGLDVRRISVSRSLYSPWYSPEFLAEYEPVAPYTLVSEARSYVLASLATQASRLDGEAWECGVYRGGTAMLLLRRLGGARPLRLFDTFTGMPETDPTRDLHKGGDFSDTSLEAVRSRVTGDFVHFHQGLIPDTFRGLESARIAFAHVDVDIYSAVRACCEFIFPRLCIGGFMVFDDYGFPSCPGARAAVDEFFREQITVPLVLQTGQAVVFKSTK